MPPKKFKLSWTSCKPYDDIVAKVDHIEQTDAGIKIHCHKVEKEKKMNKNEELKNVDTIVITRRGNTVSVEAYEVDSGVGYPVVCHKTIAECSPDDIFDFNIGAKLAFDRLYEGYDMTPKPKSKPYNGKIFVRHGGECYTLKSNHVYDVKNGVIRNEVDNAVPMFALPYIFEGMSEDELSLAVDKFVFYGTSYYYDRKHEVLPRHYSVYFVNE